MHVINMHTQPLNASLYALVCSPSPTPLTKTIDTTRVAQGTSTGLSLQSATTNSRFAHSESTQCNAKFAVADYNVNLDTYLLQMQERRYLHGMLEPFAYTASSI